VLWAFGSFASGVKEKEEKLAKQEEDEMRIVAGEETLDEREQRLKAREEYLRARVASWARFRERREKRGTTCYRIAVLGLLLAILAVAINIAGSLPHKGW